MQIAKSNSYGKEVEKELFEEKSTTVYSLVFWRTFVVVAFSILVLGAILLFGNIDQIITEPIETLITAVVIVGVEVLLLSVVNLVFKQDSSTIKNHFSQFDFNEKFEKIMTKATNYQVIVIDNLDRCSENYTVSILDFIKGFLTNDSGNYVFILPVDENRILQELVKTRHYKLDEAKEFLSKVFDYSVVMEKSRKINLYSLVQTFNETHNFEFSSRLMSIISDYYGYTPRQIIKIINLINSKRELIENSNNSTLTQEQVDVVGKTTIIREKWNLLYSIIHKNPELLSDLNKNIHDDRIVAHLKGDDELKEFIVYTRHIKCENPIMYLHNLSNDSIYNIKVMKEIQLCTFSDDLVLNKNVEKSHIEYIINQVIQEYVIKRERMNLIEIFISANRILNLYSVKGYNYSSVLDDLLELYDLLNDEYKDTEFFDDINKTLLSNHLESICGNFRNRDILFRFENFIANAQRNGDVDILSVFLSNNFTEMKMIDGNLFSLIITDVLLKSDKSSTKELESNFKEVSNAIITSDIERIVESKNLRINRLLIITQPDIVEKYSSEIVSMAEIKAAEVNNSTFVTITDKLDRLMLMSTIFIVDNKSMITKLGPSIDRNQLLNHFYTLIAKYDPANHGEVEQRITSLLADILDYSIIAKNYSLDTYQRNYLNLITNQSHILRFKFLLFRLLERVGLNEFGEKILVTSILATNFQDDTLLEKLMNYYNKTDLSLQFIIDTFNKTQITSTLSFHNITLNTAPIIEKVSDKILLLENSSFIKLVNGINFAVLAQNAKLQSLVNRDKDYRKVVITNITSFNDFQIAKRVLKNDSVITTFEDKLIEIIESTNNVTLIGEIHDDKDNVVMKRRIQNAIYDKVIEITGTFDYERYNRIDRQ